jgi:hypothetical protein
MCHRPAPDQREVQHRAANVRQGATKFEPPSNRKTEFAKLSGTHCRNCRDYKPHILLDDLPVRRRQRQNRQTSTGKILLVAEGWSVVIKTSKSGSAACSKSPLFNFDQPIS